MYCKRKRCKSMARQFWRAKAFSSGCCHVTVQGATWLAQRYSLNFHFSFIYRISLLLILSNYSIVLMRLSGSCSRPKIGIKIPEPAGNQTRPSDWKVVILLTTPRRRTKMY